MKELKFTARNVTRVARQATREEFVAGLEWYNDAHIIAQALADRGNMSLDHSVAIISALSPQRAWGQNVNLAARAIDRGGLKDGDTNGDQIAKVNALLNGADPLTVLGGLKVRSFFECIITSGDTRAVTVDAHAIDILLNKRHTQKTRPTLTPKRYASAVRAYRSAAKILSKEFGQPLTGAQVQAIAWVAWRNRFHKTNSRDVHSVEV